MADPTEVRDYLETKLADYPDIPHDVAIRLAGLESGFNPDAVGPVTRSGERARGPMQLMPGTAKDMGVTDPTDWKQNVDGGLKYLNQNIKEFGLTGGVAAYQAGPGNVRKAGGGVTSGTDGINTNADYVRKVVGTSSPDAGTIDDSGRPTKVSPKTDPNIGAGLPGRYIPAGSLEGETTPEGDGLPGRFVPMNDFAPPPPAPEAPKSSVWHDLGQELNQGVLGGVVAPVREAARQLFGDKVVGAVDSLDAQMHGKAPGTDYLQSQIDESRASISPEQSASDEKKWWDDSDPNAPWYKKFGPAITDWRSWMGGIAQSLPAQALTMIPALRMATAVEAIAVKKAVGLGIAEAAAKKAAAAGATAEVATQAGAEALQSYAATRAALTAKLAGGFGEGLLQAGQSGDQNRNDILKMTPEQLADSDVMKQLQASGMTFEEARAKIANDSATKAFVLAGVATGVLGGNGDWFLAKAMRGEIQGGWAVRALKSAVAEGPLEEFPQSYLSQVAQNFAKLDANPKQDIYEDAMNQGVQGMAIGMAQGGITGGVLGHKPTAKAAVPNDKPEEFNRKSTGELPPTEPPGAPPPAGPDASTTPPVSIAPHPGVQPDDIVTKAGAPFKNEAQANMAARSKGILDTHEPVQIDDKAYVLRRKGEGAIIEGQTPAPESPTAAPAAEPATSTPTEAPAAPVTPEPIAAPQGEQQIFTGKTKLGGEKYGASIGHLSEGTRRQLMVDPKSGYFWGDYSETTGTGEKAGTSEAVGEHAGHQPALFDGSKEARAAAEATPQDKLTPSNPAGLVQTDKATSDAINERAAAREADYVPTPKPEGMLPTDVGRIMDGQPFANGTAAAKALVNNGFADTHEVVKLAKDQYVLRPKHPEAVAQASTIAEITAKMDKVQALSPEWKALNTQLLAAKNDAAAHEAAASPLNHTPEPTKEQILAGNAKLGHMKVGPLDISIENPAGSVREDKHNVPPKWSNEMKGLHYGYILDTKAADTHEDGTPQKIDVYVKQGTPENYDGPIQVIDQKKANGHFDEHKVMAGWKNATAGKKAYLAQYEKGWDGIRSITQTSMADFLAWKENGDTTQPFADRAKPKKERTDAQLANDAKMAEKAKNARIFKPSVDSIIPALIKLGGIKMTDRQDIIGDKGNRTIPGAGALFTKNGEGLDVRVEDLRARGFITQNEIDDQVDGGLEQIRQAIADEYNGIKKTWSNMRDPGLDAAQHALEEKFNAEQLAEAGYNDLKPEAAQAVDVVAAEDWADIGGKEMSHDETESWLNEGASDVGSSAAGSTDAGKAGSNEPDGNPNGRAQAPPANAQGPDVNERPAGDSAGLTEGASPAETKEIADTLTQAEESGKGSYEVMHHLFDPPAKSDVVRLQDKVKVYHAKHGWMTVDEAKAKIREWEDHAVQQGKTTVNSDKVVLSLFDLTGEWSIPWEQAGYDVYRFDIQNAIDASEERWANPEDEQYDENLAKSNDVMHFSTEFFNDVFGSFEGKDIYAILAAAPCTDFASSGARHFAAKDADGRTIKSIELVNQARATIEYFKPSVWALENPVGRIEKLTGLPPWRLSFDPNHLGDPYTKKTLLWGRFNADLPIAPVEPTEGSKMHTQYGGSSQATKNARSATPEGFAYSFFMANNAVDHPEMAIANKYDRLDRNAIKAALDAGLTEEQIKTLVDDPYYFSLDDEKANKALYDAAKNGMPPEPKFVPTPDEPAPGWHPGTVDDPLTFSSGMTRPGDFTQALSADHHVGIEIGELSDAAMPKIARALVDSKAYLFVDTGAFSIFRANMRAKEAGQGNFDGEFGEGGKGLDFRKIMDRYEALAYELAKADDGGDSTNGRVFFVMPDIVGDQQGSIDLAGKYAENIKDHGITGIVPIQSGKLTLTQAYDALVEKLGGMLTIGIPSNAMAASNLEFEQLMKDRGHDIFGVHILGAASEKTLGPRLEALKAAGYDGPVSADANRLRSMMYGTTTRAMAMRNLLGKETTAPANETPDMADQRRRYAILAKERGYPADPANLPDKDKNRVREELYQMALHGDQAAIQGRPADATKDKPYTGPLKVGDRLAVQEPGKDYVRMGSLKTIDGDNLTWQANGGKKPIAITRWNIEINADDTLAKYPSGAQVKPKTPKAPKAPKEKLYPQWAHVLGLKDGDKVTAVKAFDYLTKDRVYTLEISPDSAYLRNEATGGGTFLKKWEMQRALKEGDLSKQAAAPAAIAEPAAPAAAGEFPELKILDKDHGRERGYEQLKTTLAGAPKLFRDVIHGAIGKMAAKDITMGSAVMSKLPEIHRLGVLAAQIANGKTTIEGVTATIDKDTNGRTMTTPWGKFEFDRKKVHSPWIMTYELPTVEKPAKAAEPERPALELGTQTQAEFDARDAAAAAEQAKTDAENAKAEAEAKAERVRNEVKQRSVAAADTFELGGSAEQNLTGQGDIFAQPEPAKSTITPSVKTDIPAAEPAVHTLAHHDELMDTFRNGTGTLEQYKAAFASAEKSKDAIMAELAKLTKDQLAKRVNSMYSLAGEKKDRLVKMAYNDMLADFTLGQSYSYGMGEGERENGIRKIVDNATEADMKAYAEKVAAARAERKERVAGYIKAIKDPQTLEDFRTFLQVQTKDKFTPDQQARYDELVSLEAKDQKKAQAEASATVQGVDAGTDMKMVETTHTKKGHALFVVQLGDRVERDKYNALNAAAKKLGGYYSAYKGAGAVPGFQFKDKAGAEQFMAAGKGETIAAGDRVEQRTEAKHNAGAERLRAMAEKQAEKANAELGKDRLTNTNKRAAQASHTEAEARKSLQMADTMRNLADAIESGKATHLDGVSQRIQIEQLDTFLRDAQREEIRTEGKENGKGYSYEETQAGRAPTAATVKFARFPQTTDDKSGVFSAIRALEESGKSGVKMLTDRLRKLAENLPQNDRGYIPDDLVRAVVAKLDGTKQLDSLNWYWKEFPAKMDRLHRMGIDSPEQLRAALREYVAYRGGLQQADKAKELERKIVGSKVGIDFFPTPKETATRMVEMADVKPGMKVLEPSAGNGNIAEAIRAAGAEPEVAEISSQLRDVLKAKEFNVVGQDFMDLKDGGYDRIIMNPPFSNNQDIQHVQHAYDLLAPGGKIVAIMGEGAFFRTGKTETEFRNWIDEHGAEVEKLDAGTFTDKTLLATTGANARLVTIEKPSAGDALFSRALGASDNNLTAALTRITADDESFRYPKPTGKDFPGIMAAIDPGYKARKMGASTAALKDAVRGWTIDLPSGKWAHLYQDQHGLVWLDLQYLQSTKDAGSKVYAAAQAYAHNNGLLFMGDPDGLSKQAFFRRGENMLSSILRYGTSDHLAPHEAQLDPSRYYAGNEADHDFGQSVRPLDWEPGNTAHNLKELLYTSAKYVFDRIPETKSIVYDFRNGRFYNADTGATVTPADFQRIAESDAGVRAAIGSATLERTAVSNAFLRAARGGAGGRLLAQVSRILRDGNGLPALNGRWYSRTNGAPLSAGLSLSETKRIGDAIAAKWTGGPQIIAVQSVKDLPTKGAPDDARGMYLDGKLYLVADNLHDEADAQFVVFHETFHDAFAMVPGVAEGANAIFNANQNVRQAAARWRQENPQGDLSDKAYRLRSINEALADLGQRAQSIKGLSRFMATLQAGLRKIGFDKVADWLEAHSDAEALQFVADAIKRTTLGASSPAGDLAGAFSKPAPIFYSALNEAIAAKAPFAKNGTIAAGQLVKWLEARAKDGTFKPDELAWSGLTDYLWTIMRPSSRTPLNEGTKVTRADIEAYLAQNGVKVTDTILGEEAQQPDHYAYWVTKGQPPGQGTQVNARITAEGLGSYYRKTVDAGTHEWVNENGDKLTNEQAADIGGEWEKYWDAQGTYQDPESGEELPGGEHSFSPTKYSHWQLPGGDNYRELLLTLPEKKVGKNEAVENADGDGWDIVGPDGNVVEAGFASQYAAERAMAAYAGHEQRTDFGAINRGGFQSSHFDQPNILAHVRFNDRTSTDGKKVLFLEELQSDWAQKGRKLGFIDQNLEGPKETGETIGAEYRAWLRENNLPQDSMDELNRDNLTAEQRLRLDRFLFRWNRVEQGLTGSIRNQAKVTPAPFVQKTEAWASLALKRMIRYAVDHGFDRVAWANGEQQADRYDLSKHINSIEATRVNNYGIGNSDPRYHIKAVAPDGRTITDMAYKMADLPDVIGKELADKVVEKADAAANAVDYKELPEGFSVSMDRHSDPERPFTMIPPGQAHGNPYAGRHASEEAAKAAALDRLNREKPKTVNFSGLDLKVGGEGMHAFYDKMLPNIANDILKKIGGGKVGEVDMGFRDRKFAEEHESPVGRPLGVVEHRNGMLTIELEANNEDMPSFWGQWAPTPEGRAAAARKLAKLQASYTEKKIMQPGFDITPAMRESAAKGLPLFARGPRSRLTIDQMIHATLTAMDWHDWYTRFEHDLRHIFGSDYELFGRFLAATSQRQTVGGNVTAAIKAYRQYLAGEPFTGYLEGVVRNLNKAVADLDMGGHKIRQFDEATSGNEDGMAIDRHVAQLLFGTDSPTPAQHRAAWRWIRTVAAELGMSPRGVQAALWAYNQLKQGKEPKSYDTYLKAKAAEIAALRAQYGRGEDAGVQGRGEDLGRGSDAEQNAGPARGGPESSSGDAAGLVSGPLFSRATGEHPKLGAIDPSTQRFQTSVDELVSFMSHAGYSHTSFTNGMSRTAIMDALDQKLGTENVNPSKEVSARLRQLWANVEDANGAAFRTHGPAFSRAPAISGTTVTRQSIVDRLTDMLRSDKTFNAWHKTIGTQFHKATVDKGFGNVFNKARAFEEDTSQFAMDAADHAPDILPRLSNFSDVFRRGPKSEDMKAVSKALHEGTLDKTVLTREQAREQGMSDRQWDLYSQARGAINTSLDDLAASEGFRLLRNWGAPESVANAAKAQPEQAHAIFKAWLQPTIDTAQEALRVAQETRDQTLAKEDEDAQRDLAAAKDVVDRARISKELTKRRDGMVFDLGNAVKKAEDHFDTVMGIAGHLQTMFGKIATLKREGYAPLMRFGNHTVYMYGDPETGREPFFSMHESQSEANRVARALHEEFPDAEIRQGLHSTEAFKLTAGISPDTLELFAKAVGAEKSELFQDFLRTSISDRSVLKRLIKRMGIEGYSTDVPRNLATFVTSNARAAARNYHFADMLEAAKVLAEDKTKGDVTDEAVKLIDYMRYPEKEAPQLRALMFMNYLGGSIASALTNATQPVLQTLPYLAQYGGAARAAQALTRASKIGAGGAIANDALRNAMARADREGITAPHEIHQLYAESIRGINSSLGWRKFSKVWGSFFSLAEQFNRKITFAAAYDIAQKMTPEQLERIGMGPYAFAAKAVEETQGVYSRANRPNWARGAVGATLFTFKQFGIQYLEMLKRLPPQQQALGFAILVVASGLQGLPFAEDLEDLIDTVGQALGYNTNSKQALRKKAIDILGATGGDMLMRGVTALPGSPVDMQQRLGLGNLIPGTALLKHSEKDKTRDIAEFFGPAGSVFQTLVGAQDKIQAGDYKGAALAAAPLAVQNAMKGMEMFQTGQYKDQRGRNVVPVDAVDALFKSIGLQPHDVGLANVRTQGVQQDIAMAKQVQADIMNRWASGVADKDPGQISAAREQLKEWNDNNPDSRISINAGALNQRVREMALERDVRMGKTAPKAMQAQVRASLRGD